MKLSVCNFSRIHQEPHPELEGVPLHYPRRPGQYKSIDSLAINGQPVDFSDQNIPNHVLRYLLNRRKRRFQRIADDCVAFAAAMCGIYLNDRNHNPFINYDETTSVDSQNAQTFALIPLVLTANGPHDIPPMPLHIVVPAFQSNGEQTYLHKIGNHGPLCISSLAVALNVVGCQNAHPVEL